MRIGFLSDAHGNAPALNACLSRLEELGADRLYFLGDAVGYLPDEREVLNLLRRRGAFCQKGNHEAMLIGELPLSSSKDRIYKIEAARERLSTADLEFIASWPNHRLLEMDDKRILLVHGSPFDYLQGYVYPDDDLKNFQGLSYDAVFMGHTHRPFIAERRRMLIVNVGSCGLPRDQGDLLAFAIYETELNRCQVFRLHFEPRQVAERFGAEVADEVYRVFERRDPGSTPFGERIDK